MGVEGVDVWGCVSLAGNMRERGEEGRPKGTLQLMVISSPGWMSWKAAMPTVRPWDE